MKWYLVFCFVLLYGFGVYFPSNYYNEHLVMGLLATCISYLEKGLFKYFGHYVNFFNAELLQVP